jgi:hypothetical protein
MQRRIGRHLILAGAALAVTIGVASGHGFGRGGFRGPEGFAGGRLGGYPGSLFQQLIFPCRAGCFAATETCNESAESTARTCVTGSCDAEITAAQTACQADRASSDCQAAVTALRTCAQSCIGAETSGVSSCRSTLSSCVTACGNS